LKDQEFHIRCTAEMKNLIARRASILDISMTSKIKNATLCPYFIKYEYPKEVESLKIELAKIGSNINQLVKAMNEINAMSKKFNDINLYLDNPDYRNLAENAASIMNTFKEFSSSVVPQLETLTIKPEKVFYRDVEIAFEEDPNLKAKIEREL